jgi:hypothetical protein
MRMSLASTSNYSALMVGVDQQPALHARHHGVQPFAVADQRVVPILYARLPAWLRYGIQIATQSAVPRAAA